MSIKRPVTNIGYVIYDADKELVAGRDVAAALNAAPDLTALEQAVEAARASLDNGDSEMEVTVKYLDIVDAAIALFPKDGTP